MTVIQEMRDKKAIMHAENKYQDNKSLSISVTTLNVHQLNFPTERQRLAELIKTHDPSRCYLEETHFMSKDTKRVKVRGCKKVFHANTNQQNSGSSLY